MGQRHFEGVIHLIRTQDKGIVAIEQPQHRQYLESWHRIERVEGADHFDQPGRNAELLFGLPQRRGNQVLVAGILSPAGEADLSPMMTQPGAAPGQ